MLYGSSMLKGTRMHGGFQCSAPRMCAVPTSIPWAELIRDLWYVQSLG